ncbi:MAG: phosphonate C-P lyase system protein PhnH, partial [Mesorhizobium sp.]
NNQRFPRGVDIILATPEGVACLPRTTRIKTMEA